MANMHAHYNKLSTVLTIYHFYMYKQNYNTCDMSVQLTIQLSTIEEQYESTWILNNKIDQGSTF